MTDRSISSRLAALAREGDINPDARARSVVERLQRMSWSYLALIFATAGVGIILLISAAGGRFGLYAEPQLQRFAFGLILTMGIALTDIKLLMRLAYPAYFGTLALLIGVEVFGRIGMGAQRWIQVGPINLQPSELMKIAIVLALARYFHSLPVEARKNLVTLVVPAVLIVLPVGLVLNQPDLGTAILIAASAGAVIFLAGADWRLFVGAAGAVAAAAPFAWSQLHAYQKDRVLTFLDPSRDPLGAGYHILQSKIALGSGGVWGRGFMQGTQSHLSFLPESQTDFVFTVLAEEFGLMGVMVLLGLYFLLIVVGWLMALQARSDFARLVGGGMVVTFSLYLFVNIAMVTGLVPVVGVPLPLISYGGTAMLTVMIGFGLILNVHIHRSEEISRNEGVLV